MSDPTSPRRRFEGRIAIVTGAAQGIGRATALQLAAEGAALVLVDRARVQCLSVLAEVQAAAADAIFVEADLEKHAGAVRMVEETIARFGRIDVAVHNVGGTIRVKPFWEYGVEEIELEIARSLWPALWCCREVIPVMRGQGSGAIVNVGSAVTRGGLYRVPYAAAKGGVHAMTLCMAGELADSGVRINCVAPGAIDNADRVIPRNPDPPSEADRERMKAMYAQTLADTVLGRMGTAGEVAAAICFLAADESSFVTGQVWSVAGGAVA